MVPQNCLTGRMATDWTTYLEPWSKVLAHAGHYSADAAEQALHEILLDIMRFDRSKPASYPNGRMLTDDVASIRVRMVPGGEITGDNLRPHTDLLAGFPYLGPPHQK